METPAADVGPEPTATGEMTTLFFKVYPVLQQKSKKNCIRVAAKMQLPFCGKILKRTGI